MSAEDECVANRYGLYGITFLNEGKTSKKEIIEKFSVLNDADMRVHIVGDTNRVFVNFVAKENAVLARNLHPEFKAVFAHDKKWPSKDADGKKGGADAKYDSDNKSNANRRSYQGSTNSLAESAVSEAAASGKNKNKYHGHQENKSFTFAPNPGTSRGTSKRKPTSDPPLLTNRNDTIAVENCAEMECVLVILANLPQWFVQGHTYRIVFEAIGIWPVEIQMGTSMKHETVRYAKIYFRNMDEALRCVNFYRDFVYMGRRLICDLNDEPVAGSNDLRSV